MAASIKGLYELPPSCKGEYDLLERQARADTGARQMLAPRTIRIHLRVDELQQRALRA